MLYTRLRAGNMDNIYGGNGVVGLFAQEYGFNSDNAVEVNRLYYSFPLAKISPSLLVLSYVWTTCCLCGLAPIRQT
jgi:hypothetical protein